jgi:hypothetical protein
MRTLNAILLIFFLASCDPDVAGEKITLPPMEFAFKVNPDTSVLRVGDTLSMHASLNTSLGTGIKLEDGYGEVGIFISRGDSIPKISENDIFTALNNVDYKLIVEGGGVKFATGNPDHLIRITSTPTGDSLIMSYKFVFLKKGLFRFNIGSSSFFEGSKGKARWSARFNVANPNWDSLWRIPGNPMPQPSEDYYSRNYLIAVTE